MFQILAVESIMWKLDQSMLHVLIIHKYLVGIFKWILIIFSSKLFSIGMVYVFVFVCVFVLCFCSVCVCLCVCLCVCIKEAISSRMKINLQT